LGFAIRVGQRNPCRLVLFVAEGFNHRGTENTENTSISISSQRSQSSDTEDTEQGSARSCGCATRLLTRAAPRRFGVAECFRRGGHGGKTRPWFASSAGGTTSVSSLLMRAARPRALRNVARCVSGGMDRCPIRVDLRNPWSDRRLTHRTADFLTANPR
jgi:hypothetical protein